jgi:ribosomal protein S18 acetylase RimI-like enzyme
MALSQNPLVARRLVDTPECRRDIGDVVMACADFSWLTEGRAPSLETVDDFFASGAPGTALKDKYGFGFYVDEIIAGVAEVIHGWNAPHKSHIGLLLIKPQFQRHGYGRAAFSHIETFARSLGSTVLRIGVIANNKAAFSFWQSVGFVRNGEVKPKMPPFTDDIVILEKVIEQSGSKK